MLFISIGAVLRLAFWTALLTFFAAMIVLGAGSDHDADEAPAPAETAVGACGPEVQEREVPPAAPSAFAGS